VFCVVGVGDVCAGLFVILAEAAFAVVVCLFLHVLCWCSCVGDVD
jgi:hypothetical protein